MAKALIIVDVQNDFLPGGALGVADGDQIIPVITNIAKNYDYVLGTMDWHPQNHFSFSPEPEFKDGSWPAHCVQDTDGAKITTDFPRDFFDAVFRKGYLSQIEAYSGFDGIELATTKKLNEWLKEHDVTEVHVVGLAFDYCVKATALDAVKNGYFTYLLLDATRAVDPVAVANQKLIQDLLDAGVYVSHSDFVAPDPVEG
jgi:nicotinamidase/pyrazinamidase